MVRHRPRNRDPRPAWQTSDAAIAASLIGLLPPSWLLPEALWSPLCRKIARTPGLADRATLQRTIANIEAALAGTDRARAAAIALDLQAAVYELRMQNLRSWRPGGWQPDIVLAGEEHLAHALSQGKGAVLWVAHFAFNSGISKMALGRRGFAVSHLSRPEHGFSKTSFGIACLNPVRCVPEDRHLAERIVFHRNSPSTAMRRMVHVLRNGGIVSVTAGAWEGSGLVDAPLFGGALTLATGAPRLALMTGAALLPVFAIRDRGQRWTTVIEAPIAMAHDAPAAQCVRDAAVGYVKRHEPWIRQFPDQWRGWKEWQSSSRRDAGR